MSSGLFWDYDFEIHSHFLRNASLCEFVQMAVHVHVDGGRRVPRSVRAALAHIPTLQNVVLHDCSWLEVASLAGCKNLKKVEIKPCPVSEGDVADALAALLAECPALENLGQLLGLSKDLEYHKAENVPRESFAKLTNAIASTNSIHSKLTYLYVTSPVSGISCEVEFLRAFTNGFHQAELWPWPKLQLFGLYGIGDEAALGCVKELVRELLEARARTHARGLVMAHLEFSLEVDNNDSDVLQCADVAKAAAVEMGRSGLDVGMECLVSEPWYFYPDWDGVTFSM